MTSRARPLRWKLLHPKTFSSPKTYALCRAGKRIIIAQQIDDGSWFWYGINRNTSNRPRPLDAVKAEALAFVKEYESENGEAPTW